MTVLRLTYRLVAFFIVLVNSLECGVAENVASPQPLIGFVMVAANQTVTHRVGTFVKRMGELGWIEGKSYILEVHSTESNEQLAGVMRNFAQRKVDVIVTAGTPAAVAARKATSTIPIVDLAMGDPVKTGLVQNLAHPESNLTGMSLAWGEGIPGKLLQYLHEIVPNLTVLGVLTNLSNPNEVGYVRELQRTAGKVRVTVRVFDMRKSEDFFDAFHRGADHLQALLVTPDSINSMNMRRIVDLAAKYRIPAAYANRDFAYAGGLLVYGYDFGRLSQRAADYVDKILKGASPGDLPIEQATMMMMVNLKTAKALGITIPESILLGADEVIR